jgi:hypothetical protein
MDGYSPFLLHILAVLFTTSLSNLRSSPRNIAKLSDKIEKSKESKKTKAFDSWERQWKFREDPEQLQGKSMVKA